MRKRGSISLLAALAGVACAAAALPAGAQPSVCPGDTEGAPGEVVCVPILIDNPQGIDAFGLEMLYDSAFLQFESVVRSQLTAAWTALDGNETTPGTVNVGGFDPTPIATSAPDTLGYVCLTVATPSQTSSYTFTSFQDDLAGAADCSGAFNPVNPVSSESWGRLKERYGGPAPRGR